MHPVKSVLYNDGNAGGEDLFALVVADKGDTKHDLVVFTNQGVSSIERDVPRREPKDYGPEGGGRTWHSG